MMSLSSGPSDGGYCYYLGVRHSEQNLVGAESTVRLNDKLSGVKNDKEIVFRWRPANGIQATQQPPKPAQLKAIFRRGATAQSPVEGQLEWDLTALTPSPEGEVIRKLRWASTRFPDGPVHLQVVLSYAPGEPISANTTGSTTAGTGTSASTTGGTTAGGTTAGTTGSTSGTSGSGGTTAGTTGGTTGGGSTGSSGSGGTTGGWTVIVDPNDPPTPAPYGLAPQNRTITVGTTLAAYNRVVVSSTRTAYWGVAPDGKNENKAMRPTHANIPASVAPWDFSLPWPYFQNDPRRWVWPEFSIDAGVMMLEAWDSDPFIVLNNLRFPPDIAADRRVLLPKTVSGELAAPHLISRTSREDFALLDNATILMNFTHGWVGSIGDQGVVDAARGPEQVLVADMMPRLAGVATMGPSGQFFMPRSPRTVPRFTGMLLYSCLFCSTPGLASSQAFANRDDVFLAGFDGIVQSFTFPDYSQPVDVPVPPGVPPVPGRPAALLTAHAERVSRLLLAGITFQDAVDVANREFPPRTLDAIVAGQPFVRSRELRMRVETGSAFRLIEPEPTPGSNSGWIRKLD